MRRSLILLAAVTSVLFAGGCGDDDDDASDTTVPTVEATTTTADAGEGASAEFCSAFTDYGDAQDGAQLNTALGTMTESLPDDAPAEVQDALETLSTGDLPASDYEAAGAALEEWATDACAGT